MFLFTGSRSARKNSKKQTNEDILAALDDEDIAEDLAARLALEDEEEEEKKRRKGKEVIDYESYCSDEDEQLARAIQESLELESYPDNGIEEDIRFRAVIPREVSRSNCVGCHKVLLTGKCVRCSRGTWHSGFIIPKNKEQVKKVQNYFIPLPSVHETDKQWGQKYCPTHEKDRTPRCCSCRRMEPRDKKYISLGDARKLCLKCLDSALMSTEECKPLLEDIKNFYVGLNMKVHVDFPVLLVERSALNDAVSEENSHNIHRLPEVRGICTFQSQMVPHIPRRRGNIFSGMPTEPYKLVPGQSKVTGICVLFGYPRMLCGEILAHEMMHAYLRQHGYPPDLPLELEEGIAQVMAYRWLEAESVAGNGGRRSSKGKRSPFEKELGEYFKKSLMDSQDPVYGEGFRTALRAVNMYGLRRTLEHIKETKRLP
ncbi:hypothetical protein MKX01_007151 [Papaver californicum]|nr:hypothetical protein MKX01_007151 [Papaver californicum]